MKELRKVCDGVFKHEGDTRPQILMLEGSEFYRFMDFFYISVEADELLPDQVLAVCRERSADPRSFEGVNSKVKLIFQDFLKGGSTGRVLEVGAGERPIFTKSEAELLGIDYVASDADVSYDGCTEVFSGSKCKLPYQDGYFDTAVALFVLHFRFYLTQIHELYRCLRDNGIFLANIYRRSESARQALMENFREAGFVVELINDPKNLCQSHQYLIAAKSIEHIQAHRERLFLLIKGQV